MNTDSLKPRLRSILPCALLMLGPVLSGCGGGGSTGTASPLHPQTATVTLTGTLQDAAGAPLVGYKVVYTPTAGTTPHVRRAEDAAGTISATTNAYGFYTLSVPVSQTQTKATLAVFNPAGTEIQSQTITLDPSQPVQTAVTTVTPALPPSPPAPPAQLP